MSEKNVVTKKDPKVQDPKDEPKVAKPKDEPKIAKPKDEPKVAKPKDESKKDSNPVWPWYVLLGIIIILLAVLIGRQTRTTNVNSVDNGNEVVSTSVPVAVPTIRIPGKGSQLDHSNGLPYARINVHDNESANAAGFFDRSIINSDNPSDIGMGDGFSVPSGWFVERDFSLSNNKFVDYMTVKPPVDSNAEEIRGWAAQNGLEEGISYEITSVIMVNGQECSVRGVDSNRVRINIYVGENWSFQTCPAQ